MGGVGVGEPVWVGLRVIVGERVIVGDMVIVGERVKVGVMVMVEVTVSVQVNPVVELKQGVEVTPNIPGTGAMGPLLFLHEVFKNGKKSAVPRTITKNDLKRFKNSLQYVQFKITRKI
jgi:hypothetical protein